eukprot:Gb_33377 [translate_table: standard]
MDSLDLPAAAHIDLPQRISASTNTDVIGYSALLDSVDGCDHDEPEDEAFVVGREEMINRVMKSLERDIGLDGVSTICSPRLISAENCYVQSDSAYSLTSSSSRLSDPEDLNMGSKCGCVESPKDELGYLLGASDEELGIPPSPTCREFEATDFSVRDDNAWNMESDLQSLPRIESSSYLMDLDLCEECYGQNQEYFSREVVEQGGLPCANFM